MQYMNWLVPVKSDGQGNMIYVLRGVCGHNISIIRSLCIGQTKRQVTYQYHSSLYNFIPGGGRLVGFGGGGGLVGFGIILVWICTDDNGWLITLEDTAVERIISLVE